MTNSPYSNFVCDLWFLALCMSFIKFARGIVNFENFKMELQQGHINEKYLTDHWFNVESFQSKGFTTSDHISLTFLKIHDHKVKVRLILWDRHSYLTLILYTKYISSFVYSYWKKDQTTKTILTNKPWKWTQSHMTYVRLIGTPYNRSMHKIQLTYCFK